MHIARRMQNVFGTERVAEDGLFTTLWRRAEMRSDAEVAQRVEAKIKARVPREQIWRDEFNYSEADIARMKQSEEYRAAISLLRLGLQGPDEQEQGQDGEP
jgi:HAMP domain-containing protein